MGLPQIIFIVLLALGILSAIFDEEVDPYNFWISLPVALAMHVLLWWGGFYGTVPAVLFGTAPWLQLWPQISLISINALRLVRVAINHGQPGRPITLPRSVLGCAITCALIYFGGFFG